MTLQQQRTQEALRALPSTGWVGRRDRAVHVLSQMAGMSDEHIATLTAGDVAIADGAATITAARPGPTRVRRHRWSGSPLLVRGQTIGLTVRTTTTTWSFGLCPCRRRGTGGSGRGWSPAVIPLS